MSLTAEEKESIISEINDRATELRSLIITIGSIIALMIPAVEYLGIVDLSGMMDDQTDELSPTCEVDYMFSIEFVVVEEIIMTFAEAIDVNNCNENHIVEIEVLLHKDGLSESESQQGNLKNRLSFDPIFEDLEPGWWTIVFIVSDEDNYWEVETYAEVLTEDEQEEEVYGCTDPDALNYNDEATLDDNTCEYEQEPIKGCGDNNTAFLYEHITRWNNTSLNYEVQFDVDTDCYDDFMDVGVYIWLDMKDGTNATDMIWIQTKGDAWDYHWINFSFEKEPEVSSMTLILYNPDGSEYQRKVE